MNFFLSLLRSLRIQLPATLRYRCRFRSTKSHQAAAGATDCSDPYLASHDENDAHTRRCVVLSVQPPRPIRSRARLKRAKGTERTVCDVTAELLTKKTHETDESPSTNCTNRRESLVKDVAMDEKYAMSLRTRSAREFALDPPGFDPSKASRSKMMISDRQPSTSGGAPAGRPALDAEALAVQQSALRLRRAY